MNSTVSKSQQATITARLAAVRMAGHDRVHAEAQLARAEAMAELLARAASGLARLTRTLVIRPLQRLSHSA